MGTHWYLSCEECNEVVSLGKVSWCGCAFWEYQDILTKEEIKFNSPSMERVVLWFLFRHAGYPHRLKLMTDNEWCETEHETSHVYEGFGG